MSLSSIIQEYNDIEQDQERRLKTVFKLMKAGSQGLIVVGGEAGEGGEELRSFNNHQWANFWEQVGRRDITFWSKS